MSATLKFQAVQVQVSIFTPEQSSRMGARALDQLRAAGADRYDGDVTSLPISEDAPRQVPRIMLKSADDYWRLQAAPDRVDSVHVRLQPDIAPIVAECVRPILRYAETATPAVGRLAVIVTQAAPHDDPNAMLVRTFCNSDTQEGPCQRSDAFEIHNLRRYRLPETDVDVNSWVRCSSGVLPGTHGAQPAVLAMQDINTMAEELDTRRFTLSEMELFFTEAPVEMASAFGHYFPVNG